MKKPGDLANVMKGRDIGKTIRETWVAPRAEAQKRVKQLFEEFPRGTYLTKIEPGGRTIVALCERPATSAG
jgi:hypothetical protein